MESGDLERIAESAYETPGVPTKVARELGIEVRWVPHLRMLGASGKLAGRTIIAVRSSLSFIRRQFVVAHELGHYLLSREGVPSAEQQEDWCDYVGAAIQMPRGAFRRRSAETGQNWTQLALDFHVTETSAALRRAETTGEPMAIVCPHRVYARGEAQWPEETTLRRWARQGGPGLRTARLGDDRRRTVVEMESACDVG
jgi:hypothetical protein